MAKSQLAKQDQESKFPEISDDGTFIGNQDQESKFPLPADWAGQVCVNQCQIETMNGGIFEIPNTHQMQTYAPDVYEKLIDTNFFSEGKMKVVVLHDPR